MKSDEHTRYCSFCGALMRAKLERREPKFDVKTGEELVHYYTHWKCPNKKWWGDGHDTFTDRPDPLDASGY